MTPHKVSMQRSLFVKSLVSASLVFGLFYTQIAFAQAVPDAGTMLSNFAKTIPQLMRLVTACAYVMGMWFVYQGVVSLKEFGEQRSAGSTFQEPLQKSLILIGVGSLLIYLPSSVQSGMTSFWSHPNPYGYVKATIDPWETIKQDAFLVVQLFGTIAFIRGLVILSSMGGQGGQPGTFGKGLTFIISGTMCINLYDFINAIDTTLGLPTN